MAWTLYEGTCYMKSTFAGLQPCQGCVAGVVSGTPSLPLPRKWRMAGMTFTGGRYCPNVTMGSADSFQSMKHLKTTGATW